MKLPFFGPSNSQKIEKIDNILVEVQTEMNMTSRKIDQAEKQAKDIIRKAIGASPTQKKMLALEVKRRYNLARIQQRKLAYHFTVYSAALSIKQGLETRELESEGALKALQKIAGASNLTELKAVMTKLAHDERKMGAKFAAMQQQIDDTQEELSENDMTDTSFLDIMNELEGLPPEKVDETLNAKVRFETEKAGG